MSISEPAWDHYRTVLAVLDEGSLSAAARSLGLTQPTIGRHIEALERSLGTALFTRSQTGLAPTEAALALKPYAESLRDTAAALRRAATAAEDRVEGSVRITVAEIVGAEIVPPILTKLRRDHPALAIELVLSDRNSDLLQREADIAIRMTEPRHAALLVRRIGRIEVGLHAHRSYIERCGAPADIAALRDHAVIGYDQETAFIRDLRTRGLGTDFDRAMFALRCDNSIAQLAAIRAGFGIGLCHVGFGRRDQNLIRLLPDVAIGFDTFVVMHEDLRANRRCRAVFDALVDGMTEYVKSGA